MCKPDKDSYMLLGLIPEIGSTTAMRLLRHFGSPAAIFSATKERLMEVERVGKKAAESIVKFSKSINISPVKDALANIGGNFICIEDNNYPGLLRSLQDSPTGLYCMGNADLNAPMVSIVGSRICTVYGQSVARKFAAAFARAGLTVVSGMARGIDTAAHIGAMEVGGKTIAILGCGVDVIYPPENIDLYKKIIDNGAVLSEFPLGTRADRQTFPIRNRLISGISLATIVVESDTRGGSMITARLAAEQGRAVFAIPGRIDSPSSRGCHALIRDGATLAASPEDVLEALQFSGQLKLSLGDTCNTLDKAPSGTTVQSELPGNLGDDEFSVLKALDALDDATADAISELTKLPIQKCLAALLMLEIKKLAGKNKNGAWQRRAK